MSGYRMQKHIIGKTQNILLQFIKERMPSLKILINHIIKFQRRKLVQIL